MKERNLLLLGSEEGDKNDRLEEEKRNLINEYPDIEIQNFYATEEITEQVATALTQPSLFSSTRLVIIKYLESAKKNGSLINLLSSYLSSPENDCYLIMLSSDNSSPFAKNQKNLESVIFWEEFESNKISWIKKEFLKNGFSATDASVEEILSSVENNKAEMRNLITTIASYYRQKEPEKKVIDDEDVSSVTTRQKGETGSSLFSFIAKRDFEGSLMIIDAIALQDQSRLVGALMMLTSDFRMLENCLEKKEKRMPLKEIFESATSLSTSFAAQKGIPFRKRQAFENAMKNYSLSEVDAIIRYLLKNDTALKSAGSDMQGLFEDIVYNIVINNGKKTESELYVPLETKIRN